MLAVPQNFFSTNSVRFVHNHFGLWLIHFELGTRFLDLRSVLFQLRGEPLYLLLLLRDRGSQVLNFQIKPGLLSGMGNGLGLDARGFTGIPAGSNGHCAQPSIGIDEHDPGNPVRVVNVRTIDVADIADASFLAKATVHTIVVADDNVIIDVSDPRPGQSAYAYVVVGVHAVLERQITDGRVVGSTGVA